MLVSWFEGSEWGGLSQWIREEAFFDAGKSKKGRPGPDHQALYNKYIYICFNMYIYIYVHTYVYIYIIMSGPD